MSENTDSCYYCSHLPVCQLTSEICESIDKKRILNKEDWVKIAAFKKEINTLLYKYCSYNGTLPQQRELKDN